MVVIAMSIFMALYPIELIAQKSPANVVSSSSESKPAFRRPWANRALSPERRAELLLKEMTLDEKITMVHGAAPCVEDWTPQCRQPVKGYIGYVPPNRRLGIPALTLADGRAAVGNGAHDITLLPAPIAAASSWDVGLMNTFGRVLGREQWIKGTNVALAPSIDVVRVPAWGRTFESYGEDPYFNSRMAVAEIKGIQSQGPIADANMYVTMNQEDNRFKEDSRVDERTLHEIYLPPFAAAVRDAHVGTFMCAYVRTNGVYSCESDYLLNEVLRKQLRFDGWVMSDWGATHSTVESVDHGLDQEMPDGGFLGDKLKAAVENGQVSMEVLDSHVLHILVPMFQHGLFDQPNRGSWSANARSPEHDMFSRKVAEEGTVLLKNDRGILPLSESVEIAVIGAAGSARPKIEGGGSSQANAPYVISPLEGIRKRLGEGGTTKVSFADGSSLSESAAVARKAGVAIVFANTEETEGTDRPNLELPGNQDALIEAVAAVNRNTIVVLDTGGPVLMPWLDLVAGVIEAWYPGQEDGNAIAAILYGDVNPSAKLPLTFPRSAEAIPTASKEQWPGVDGRSIYSEGLNVGYRWYDATNTQPLFPFGFGLSYTTFSLSRLAIEPEGPTRGVAASSGSFVVHVDVTNTGARKGAEVVQVYVAHPAADGEPPHQLRSFAKVQLRPGETKIATMILDPESFMTYDPDAHKWVRRAGTYGVLVGTSSRDLPLMRAVTIR